MKIDRSRITKKSLLSLFPALLLLTCLTACDPGPITPIGFSGKVDSVLIRKQEHLLQLMASGKAVRTYKVALGRGGLAPKQKEGDARTPEGRYTIDARKEHSHYYRALHISYPEPSDRLRAAKAGVSPGGDIMIHGIQNGLGWLGSMHRIMDWTQGCIAVNDKEMDEIWKLVPTGTPVEIKP